MYFTWVYPLKENKYYFETAKVNNCNNPKILKSAIKCFFGDKTFLPESKKRIGEIDLGWLDRIGYKHDPALQGIEVNYFKDIPTVLTSDHTPVILNVTVNI